MKPVIGLIPLIDEKKDSYWMLPGYMEAIIEAGGTPIMLPLTSDQENLTTLINICDGFIFTGGHDIAPSYYHQEESSYLGEIVPQRDEMEFKLLSSLLALDKPILGICRGIQLLNVALGGTLYQDLPHLCPSDINHRQDAPYDQSIHQVSLITDSPLHQLLKQDTIGVNSCHHQAIKDLGSSLEIMASADDGIIEAIYLPDKRFIWAVQWHPEFSYLVNKDSKKIFKALVQACKQ